mmetsp:Transcript_28605/g.47635  ORF Transcript_28605/g.47635 Transcript_28605/m.47635 type:complete len:157 (+) Transcript_28605:71-541(+)
MVDPNAVATRLREKAVKNCDCKMVGRDRCGSPHSSLSFETASIRTTQKQQQTKRSIHLHEEGKPSKLIVAASFVSSLSSWQDRWECYRTQNWLVFSSGSRRCSLYSPVSEAALGGVHFEKDNDSDHCEGKSMLPVRRQYTCIESRWWPNCQRNALI